MRLRIKIKEVIVIKNESRQTLYARYHEHKHDI